MCVASPTVLRLSVTHHYRQPQQTLPKPFSLQLDVGSAPIVAYAK
jgi:hypothetical protein